MILITNTFGNQSTGHNDISIWGLCHG